MHEEKVNKLLNEHMYQSIRLFISRLPGLMGRWWSQQCAPLTVVLLAVLHEVHALQLLEDVADQAARPNRVVFTPCSPPGPPAILLAQQANAQVLSEVQLPGDGRCGRGGKEVLPFG